MEKCCFPWKYSRLGKRRQLCWSIKLRQQGEDWDSGGGHQGVCVWMLMIKSLMGQALVWAGPPGAPLTAHSLLLYETEQWHAIKIGYSRWFTWGFTVIAGIFPCSPWSGQRRCNAILCCWHSPAYRRLPRTAVELTFRNYFISGDFWLALPWPKWTQADSWGWVHIP